jgi:glycosyltransferase involved in cell wall biosynthesis
MSAMAALYRRAHAFVLPTRGEGWCLPLLEAMVAGVPAVATAWSGLLEFATERRAHLIRVARMSEAAGSGADFARGQRWAEPSVKHLQRIMRRLASGREVDADTSTDGKIGTPAPHNGRHGGAVYPVTAVDALYAAVLAHAAADPIEVAELQWRYARLAPGVRQRALRAQRELIVRYNREAVARIVMRRLRAIARRL